MRTRARKSDPDTAPGTSDFEGTIGARYHHWLSIARVASRYGHDPHELVQEAICCALVQMRKGTVVHDIDRYICRSIRRKFLDLARRRERAPSRSDLLGHMREPESPESVCYAKSVIRHLSDLPPHQRRILEQAARGSSYQEISATLNVPVGTVMSRLSRARAALRAALGE